MSKVEEFYNTLIKDPDLDIKAGQTRQQAARQEAEYRGRQYDNNVQALALANEPTQVESPINSLFNHLEQMTKSIPDTALIKAREDFEVPADEDSPNTAQEIINNKAKQLHTNIKNEERQRKLKGQNYKRVLQEHESDKTKAADRANRSFGIFHENAKKKYNDRQTSFRNEYAIRESKAKDLEDGITIREKTKTARKQAVEDYKNSLNNANKSISTEIKQDRKRQNDNRIRSSADYKKEFKNVEQRNLERAKRLQDIFAGETKADRIDEYRKTLQEGTFPGTAGVKEKISFDEAQRRMYPEEGQAHPTQAEQYSIIRRSRGVLGQDLSNAEVKSLLNGKPLTDKEAHQQLINNPRFPNINSVEDAKAAISPKSLTDENIFQNLIDSSRFPNINSVEDAKATMNPKPFTKKEKYDILREQLSRDTGLFDRLRNKKVTDADITAALNPKQLTREEKIDRLMAGKDSGGVTKLSREEALEALKPPKQLTNKEKPQSLVGSYLYPDVKTEDDAKNLLNPKPLTEQQQHEYIANRFSLSGPEEAAKAINATPFTDEEKIQFVQNDAKNRSFGTNEISAEEAGTILNPKNKHFERPTFADDTPAETESATEEPVAEEPKAEEPAAEAPAEEPTSEVETPTEQPTEEEPETTPEAETTGMGAINRDAAEILQEENDKIADNNKKIESNQNKISEIDSRREELESKQDSEEGLSEQEFQDLQGLPDEKKQLESDISTSEEEITSATGMQDAVVEGMKRNHQLTDDDVSKLREATDVNALIDEGTQPETTQEETTPEPEQPEVTPEQSTDTPPAASRINPRTAAAAKEHLGEERYNELLENGDLEGKNIADIREEFPKPDSEQPTTEESETTTAEEEPEVETAGEPETEGPQAETAAEEPEPQAATPEMDDLIDKAKQNQTNEDGEEIEGSSLFDHLYNQTHGDNPFGDTKEEFEQSFRSEDPAKLKTKLRTEHTKLETTRARQAEQDAIKRQASKKQEANTLPHDESDFKDISENDATQMATELVAHHEKHQDNVSPATKTKIEKILAAGKNAGADYEKIAADLEKYGENFGSEEHYKDLEEHHAKKDAEAEQKQQRFIDVRSKDENTQAKRRASGMEAADRGKEFHHGDDLGTKSTMSSNEHGEAENFGHSSHDKSSASLDNSNMPPALRENAEEMGKDNPNKELIAKNKTFLAQKNAQGYKWHPETKHWVHEEGLNSLLGSHTGNAGSKIDGQHQAKGHPPTLLNGNGSTTDKQLLFSNLTGLQEIGGDSLHGQALAQSLKTGSYKSQNALSSSGGKNGVKLNNVSSHTNHSGLTTQDTLKTTATTVAQTGGQKLGSAVSRLKTSFTDSFLGKAEHPSNYLSSVELLVKTYSHQSRVEARELLEETSKKKKSIKKSSIITIS